MAAPAKSRPSGSGFASRPVAVIDIGSNSVRLVAYDRLDGAPLPIYNDKVLCGLGRELNSTGRLDPVAVSSAVTAITRFVRMAEAMGAHRIDLIATAAVREAENGPDFRETIERICGRPVTVLSGAEEGRLAGLGVLSGDPLAAGLAGDLGGGSLELVGLAQGKTRESGTLSIGPLRLMADGSETLTEARRIADAALSGLDWLAAYRGRPFHAVGGAWRALARYHMAECDYPLKIIHRYEISGREARDLARTVAAKKGRDLAGNDAVPKRRADALPYAALVMDRLIGHLRPEKVIFSAFGLREGHLRALQSKRSAAHDPLIVAAGKLGRQLGRFGSFGEALDEWVAPLFGSVPPEFARLRLTTCHLSDISWLDHPDYRAETAFERILGLPLGAVDHPDRIFLATALRARYGGGMVSASAGLDALLAEDRRELARTLGLALRLAYSLSGGVRDILAGGHLIRRQDHIVLAIGGQTSIPPGETVERRLSAVARSMGVENWTMEREDLRIGQSV